jgi:4-carboxymuconolactone decarboxylase
MASDRYDRGLEIRRKVAGSEYVDRALAQADDFTGPLQDLVTEYCWGEVWGREGLDHKVRSLLNLVMLTALNRSVELKVHVRGALRNGCTKEEIREALLQATIYCGVPAGIEAFRVARSAFEEAEREDGAEAAD